MKILNVALIMLIALPGSAMAIETSLTKADLQNAHDNIVAWIKSADSDEILRRLRCMKSLTSNDDMSKVLNFARNRSILYHALATKGIHDEVIEFLLKHGADANFVVKKHIRKKGRKPKVIWLTANEIALRAGHSRNIIELLGMHADPASNSVDDDLISDRTDEYSEDDDASTPRLSVEERAVQQTISSSLCEAVADVSMFAFAAIMGPYVHSWLIGDSILQDDN